MESQNAGAAHSRPFSVESDVINCTIHTLGTKDASVYTENDQDTSTDNPKERAKNSCARCAHIHALAVCQESG